MLQFMWQDIELLLFRLNRRRKGWNIAARWYLKMNKIFRVGQFQKTINKQTIFHMIWRHKWDFILCLLIVSLFVCLWFYVPLKDFSLIWRRHHYRWMASNFDLCSGLMAIEQWGFINVPHCDTKSPFIMVIFETYVLIHKFNQT